MHIVDKNGEVGSGAQSCPLAHPPRISALVAPHATPVRDHVGVGRERTPPETAQRPPVQLGDGSRNESYTPAPKKVGRSRHVVLAVSVVALPPQPGSWYQLTVRAPHETPVGVPQPQDEHLPEVAPTRSAFPRYLSVP